jgi:hypothetical protein
MALSQWQFQYQLSPIFLTGGVASNASGGMLPFIALTNPEAFDPETGESFQLDDAFAIFQPTAGGSLVEQTPAQYPLANLSVAANSIIRQPINLQMIMLTPMKSENSWSQKISIMTALKATLDQHNNAGGTYAVSTPAWLYTDMLMLSLTDVSSGSSPLPQNAWRWEFTRPLVSMADAQGAMSNLMSQITNGGMSSGVTTSPTTALGASPSVVNTGLDAGPSSPFISQTPMVATSTPVSTPGPSMSQSPSNVFGNF